MRGQEIILRASEYLLTRCEWFLRREEIRLKKLKEEKTTRLQGWEEKPRGMEKVKRILISQVNGCNEVLAVGFEKFFHSQM